MCVRTSWAASRRMAATVSLCAVLCSPLASLKLCAQVAPPAQANEARVDRLLSQMTLEEKMDLIRGGVEPAATNQGQAGYLAGVPGREPSLPAPRPETCRCTQPSLGTKAHADATQASGTAA